MDHLNCAVGVQVVMKPQIYKTHEFKNYKIIVISAASFLQLLV